MASAAAKEERQRRREVDVAPSSRSVLERTGEPDSDHRERGSEGSGGAVGEGGHAVDQRPSGSGSDQRERGPQEAWRGAKRSPRNPVPTGTPSSEPWQ